MNRITTTTFLGALLFVGAFSLQARAAIRKVDRTDDPLLTPFACTAAPNDCSLRGAVEFASAGDTINFDSSVEFHTIQLRITVSVNQNNLTINGPGDITITTVTGAAPVLTVSNNVTNAAISGLTITNPGDSSGNGSGFQILLGASATLSNMVFNNNNTVAIDNDDGANLTVNNSVFSNNSGPTTGPTLGGTINVAGGSLTVSGSTFSNNKGVESGGIRCGNEGHVTVMNSLFNSNTATGGGIQDGDGGAININRCPLYVINSTFTGNHAHGKGGAVFSQHDGTVVFRQLTVTNNSAVTAAGGLDSSTDTAELSNSIVTGNSAPIGSDFVSAGTTGGNNIIGGNAGLNPLGNYGGQVQTFSLRCDSPALNAGNNAFSLDANGNQLTTDGRGAGFPRNLEGTVDIGAFESNRSFVSNVSDNISTTGSLRKAINDAPAGGAICFDSVFFSTPRTISMGGSEILIDKGLTINGPGTNLLTLDANNLSRHLFLSAGTLDLSGMTFIHGSTNGSDPQQGSGGSIFANSGTTLNASNLAITGGSTPENFGGCIYSNATLNLSDSSVANCQATGNGGAIDNNLGTMTLTRTSITGSTAIQGGGILNFATLNIDSSTISGNTATRPPNAGSAPVGGGIYNLGNLSFANSTLSNNSAQFGGGLYNVPGTLTNGYADIHNSTISGNTAVNTGNGATADGGGIYADGTYAGGLTATIDAHSITMSGNTAVNSGGGLFMHQDSGNFAVCNVNNVIIAGNSASTGPDISGEVISYSHNLIGNTSGNNFAGNSPSLAGNILNPAGGARLKPLGNYGGPTQTVGLMGNSPALNAGDPGFVYPTDQRGFARPVGQPDIGAFEAQNLCPTTDQATDATVTWCRSEAFDVTFTPISPSSAGTVPNGYTLCSTCPAYDITANGTYTPPVTICLDVPVSVDQQTFAVLKLMHGESGQLVDRTTYSFTDVNGKRWVCGSVNSLSPFALAQGTAPTAANGSISGRITDANGVPVSGAAIILSGTESREAITDASGAYGFASVETNGFYTVTPSRANYSFSPPSRSFSLLGVHTEASFTASPNGDHANAIDTMEFFVRQQYLDFLGREPDPPGFSGWVNTIRNCAPNDPSCDRVHVSEMFFRSAEFQQRGYFVYRFYSTAFGRKPDYSEFTPDLARVSGFLTDEQLETAKAQFANDFTTRAAFINQYGTLGNSLYVDALSQTAGVTLSNRQALIDSLNAGTMTRAQALRQISESGEVYAKYYNQAFVVMEYFGYLRRDPDALYLNWIQVLDANPTDSRHMVEGFVDATEYRNRW